MPYVQRGNDGGIINACRWDDLENPKEFVKEDNQEIVDFRGRRNDIDLVENAIKLKMRVLAIEALKVDDKIDVDYPEPEIPDVKNTKNNVGQ